MIPHSRNERNSANLGEVMLCKTLVGGPSNWRIQATNQYQHSQSHIPCIGVDAALLSLPCQLSELARASESGSFTNRKEHPMPPTKGKQAGIAPRHPEKKYGPFQGGCGLAIWLNEVKTENGPRFFRSLTLQPRRYLDPKTGKWK